MTMDWMIVEPSLEQKLTLECTCRGVLEQTDLEQMQSLCIALVKQNWYQGQLLSQAVNHIAHLDGFISEELA